MPELKRFGSFKMLMFFRDENPPHDIKGPDFSAKVRISNGEVLAGQVPARALRVTRRWIEQHQAELIDMWTEFQR